jgi:heme oxygenase
MTPVQPAVEPLSMAMRSGSLDEHRAAEGSAFMTELLAGRVGAAGYAAYLGRLWHPYAALEAAIRRRRDDRTVAAVYDPALERLTALEADLAFWSSRGGVPADPPKPTAAVAAYVDRVAHASAWGGFLVAHHYTRYLGDLSGGQVIGRILQRAFDLDGAGIAFYEFARVPRPKPYRDGYRARLDALELTAAERGSVVAEVRTAFRLNRALFAELETLLPAYRR